MARLDRASRRGPAAAAPAPPADGAGTRSREQPAQARAASSAGPGTPYASGGRARNWLVALWAVAGLGAAAGIVAVRTLDAGRLPQQLLAVLLGVLLVHGLAVRTGGPTAWAVLLALLIGGGAVASGWTPLLAGAALGTAVVGAVLALLGTTQAPGFAAVVREVVLAQLVAAVAGIGALGLSVPLAPIRFHYAALGVTLLVALALVYRLGLGLHGLGPGGILAAGVAVLVLAVAIAYAQALAHWGSPQLVDQVDSTREWLRGHFGGVPHVTEYLVGVPALAIGVFTRARRRQGWWICAFGAAATAPAATRLVEAESTWSSAALTGLYSVLLGLVIGYAAIRVDQRLHGTRGRRSRRVEERSAHRPEPGRTQPLR